MEKKHETLSFYATQRHQVPSWIIKKIADLVSKAKRLEDSSSVLYACLEARNLLENISFTKLLCSVPASDRDALSTAMKPRRGIEKADKELKTLGLKTQEFMSIISMQENHPFPIFKFAESSRIQDKLSQYVHNYAVEERDILYGSEYIKNGFRAVAEAVAFAKDNMHYFAETNTYGIVNADMTNLPEWGSKLLADWKSGVIKDAAVLDAAIKEAAAEYVKNKALKQ